MSIQRYFWADIFVGNSLVSANDILTVTGALLAPATSQDTTSSVTGVVEASSTQEKAKKEKKEKKKSKKEKS